MRRTRLLLCGILTALLVLVGHDRLAIEAKSPDDQVGIQAEEVADYIHAVIEANRTVYTTHVVQWLQDEHVVLAAEQWEREKGLLLPAQMLLYAGLLAAETGGGIQYRLASLWPLYSRNGPATEFEQRGLEAVAKDPGRPYTGVLKSGQGHSFKAVYADRAVSQVCVSCHNAHRFSPRKDYQLNDVMGGIIISFPVDTSTGQPRVRVSEAANYIQTVIQADRTVYAKLVVDRLQDNGVVRAEEQWRGRKALPLPAQMLRYAGKLASETGSGLQYRLASLWPIYSRNGPATEFEQRGLEAVAKDPGRPYTGLLKSGQGHSFKAVYADRAVSQGCVSCHNGHPSSPRKDYRLNDVMGGIIISFPIESE